MAVYSTFFSRAFDQANLDVGLHGLPVVFALDRAGITGDDGPSHHGILDMALCLKIPGMTIFAPSSAQELKVMLGSALGLSGPCRCPLPEDGRPPGACGPGGPGPCRPGWCAKGTGRSASWPSAKCSRRPRRRPTLLAGEGVEATLWDVRVVRPLDPAMVADAGEHAFVVTVEDGIRNGGAGNFIADAIADLNANRQSPPVLNLGVPTAYIPHSKADRILGQLGLDGPGIAASIFKAIDWAPEPRGVAEIRLAGPGTSEEAPLPFYGSNGSGTDEAGAAAVVDGGAVANGHDVPVEEDVTTETPLPAGR